MFATKSQILAMMLECVNPSVPPDLFERVINGESSFNQYAIAVTNRTTRVVSSYMPDNLAEAYRIASKAIEEGGNHVALGTSQILSSNLDGISVYQALDNPCDNIMAGSSLLAYYMEEAASKGYDRIEGGLRGYYTGRVKPTKQGQWYVEYINADPIIIAAGPTTEKWVSVPFASNYIFARPRGTNDFKFVR